MSWAELWKEVFLMEGRLDPWLQLDPLEYLLAPPLHWHDCQKA